MFVFALSKSSLQSYKKRSTRQGQSLTGKVLGKEVKRLVNRLVKNQSCRPSSSSLNRLAICSMRT